MLLAPYVCFHIFSYVKVTEWPLIWKIAAHSACDMFHGISLVFSHLGFWSENLFLIAPFPDLCLLVPFNMMYILNQLKKYMKKKINKIKMKNKIKIKTQL